MNLVLSHISRQGGEVSVLVTADERGEYVQYLLEKAGGDAVRIGYGFCNAGTLKEILKSMENDTRSVAIAMDGPLGPRHIPQKLIYFLSEKSNARLTGVTLSYPERSPFEIAGTTTVFRFRFPGSRSASTTMTLPPVRRHLG